MIITRKIEIRIDETDKKLAKEYKNQLFVWRDLLRSAANAIVSHKFVQQNIRDFTYINEGFCNRFVYGEDGNVMTKKNGQPVVEPFHVKDILADEKGNSEQNTTYRIASKMLKGKCPSDFFACLNQIVCNNYKERYMDFLKGNVSIPSYRNIVIPFPGKKLQELNKVTKSYEKDGKTKEYQTYVLDFYHIPVELFFGQDRSNNKVMIERALSGEYKFCGSSIKIEDGTKATGKKLTKIFLCVSLDIPQKENKLKEDKILYAALDIDTPVIWSLDKKLEDPQVALSDIKNIKKIGNKEEYLYQRLRIQEALHRTQINAKYSKGGHGRKNKLKAIERFEKAESNYCDTKMHTYSRALINEALRNGCATIVLVDREQKLKDIKDTEKESSKFLLRNWGYAGLQAKVEYKAKMQGIRVIVPKTKKEEE